MTTKQKEDTIVPVREAARTCGVSRHTICKWIERGHLDGHEIELDIVDGRRHYRGHPYPSSKPYIRGVEIHELDSVIATFGRQNENGDDGRFVSPGPR